MECKLQDGDYVADRMGGVQHLTGTAARLQRVLFKLTARRGAFPLLPELGSELDRIGTLPQRQWESAAMQAVCRALSDEDGLSVDGIELSASENGKKRLKVYLTEQEEQSEVVLEIG